MFPFRRLKICTRLTPRDITDRLQGSPEIRGFYGDSHFKYHKRWNSYVRNSFFSVVKGNYEEKNGYTIVNIKMRMHIAIMVFCIHWLAGVSLGVLCGLVLLATGDMNNGWGFTLGCLGMILFFQLLMHIPFHFDAKWNKNFLNQLLEASDVNMIEK
ncbi:MAG: hypothetical protein E7622_05420 [Ruminococcaceae bacterium]|nr:hypothetical protein [Oscillospiraceae bacterium]